VLRNGREIFPAMLEAIRAAEQTINFATYVYWTGSIAPEFAQALAERAEAGVQVNVLLDAVGAAKMDRRLVALLQRAGAEVAWFRPPKWYTLHKLNNRTHRKILVVDGEVGFTGGAGIADHWTGNAEDPDHWRDTMVEIDGPAARLLEGGFYENFTEAADEVVPELDDSGPVRGDAGAAFVVRSSPSGGVNDMKRLFLLGIAAARRSIDITTPYFMPDESSRWSLADAVRRGVRIRLLVEGDKTDAKPVKHASRRYYEELLKLGIEIYEYQPTMMHAKTFVVDDAWSLFGSANFDNRSLELNEELNVAVTSRDLASRLGADFEQDLRVARQLRLEEWRKRSLLNKVRERFWSAFSEVF
jgi:cardiolipin synthase